jgi:voltage-gated potassium channel
VPLFAALDASAISEIMKIMRTRMVQAGTVVAARGDEAEGMYFIADGEMHIRHRKGVIKLGPGDFFGEITLLKKVLRRGTVVAATRCHLLMIDAIDFESLLNRDEALKARIAAVADERFADWAEIESDVLDEELEADREPVRPMGDPIV